MEDGLGAKFWLWIFGVVIAGIIGVVLLFVLVGKAWYSWGFLGALIVLGGLLLGAAWIHDRRQTRDL
jgi:hypothetical protein